MSVCSLSFSLKMCLLIRLQIQWCENLPVLVLVPMFGCIQLSIIKWLNIVFKQFTVNSIAVLSLFVVCLKSSAAEVFPDVTVSFLRLGSLSLSDSLNWTHVLCSSCSHWTPALWKSTRERSWRPNRSLANSPWWLFPLKRQMTRRKTKIRRMRRTRRYQTSVVL